MNPGGLARKIPGIPRKMAPNDLPIPNLSDLANYNSHLKRSGQKEAE